jgi:hypothetical protein
MLARPHCTRPPPSLRSGLGGFVTLDAPSQAGHTLRRWVRQLLSRSISCSIPTNTARSVPSSSQSIRSSAKVRVCGVPQYAPTAWARAKSGSVRTWSSSARGAGPRASKRARSRRSSSSGRTATGYAVVPRAPSLSPILWRGRAEVHPVDRTWAARTAFGSRTHCRRRK